MKRFKRHDIDSEFERFLEIVRFDKITDEIMNIFHRREQKFRIEDLTHKCTSLYSRKDEVLRFNALLLQRVCNSFVIVHKIQDRERNENLKVVHKQFVKKSNLLNEMMIVFETRMMFLKNNVIVRNIVNDNCELIIKIDDKDYFIVIFSMIERIEIRIFSSSFQRY